MTNLVPFNNANETTINPTVNAAQVGELKGLLAPARSKGLTVAIVEIPRDMFAIDESYQTPERTGRSLSYLTNDFRKERLLPVTGVPHDEEGKVYLVDGYGRWQASGIVDAGKKDEDKEYETLQCMIILNAPTDPKERQKYEAEQYAFQNIGTSRVTPLQKHGAYTCMEYPAALILNKMKEKYDFVLSKGQGQRAAGILGSYSTAFNICRVNGEECAEYIFGICKGAGFHIKPNGYSTYVLMALRDVWKYYPDNREQTAEYLANWLREREPAQFKAKAMARYGLLDHRTACSLYLEDLLVDNIDLHHVRTVEGKSVTVIGRAS